MTVQQGIRHTGPFPGFFSSGVADSDPEVAGAIKKELGRQQHEIELIASENIVSKAVLALRRDGTIRKAAAASFGPDPLVSMNAWVLPPSIFESARAIAPSVRGELELQDAVRHNIHELGERYRVLPFDEPVVDLSSRSDIPVVTRLLQDREVLP